MILFSEIFDRAVNLFDDPDIRRDYVLDPAGFQQEMRPFLINGLHKWTSPTEITDRLTVYSDAVGKVEIIDGEDIDTYALASHPVENSANFIIPEIFYIVFDSTFLEGNMTLRPTLSKLRDLCWRRKN